MDRIPEILREKWLDNIALRTAYQEILFLGTATGYVGRSEQTPAERLQFSDAHLRLPGGFKTPKFLRHDQFLVSTPGEEIANILGLLMVDKNTRLSGRLRMATACYVDPISYRDPHQIPDESSINISQESPPTIMYTFQTETSIESRPSLQKLRDQGEREYQEFQILDPDSDKRLYNDTRDKMQREFIRARNDVYQKIPNQTQFIGILFVLNEYASVDPPITLYQRNSASYFFTNASGSRVVSRFKTTDTHLLRYDAHLIFSGEPRATLPDRSRLQTILSTSFGHSLSPKMDIVLDGVHHHRLPLEIKTSDTLLHECVESLAVTACVNRQISLFGLNDGNLQFPTNAQAMEDLWKATCSLLMGLDSFLWPSQVPQHQSWWNERPTTLQMFLDQTLSTKSEVNALLSFLKSTKPGGIVQSGRDISIDFGDGSQNRGLVLPPITSRLLAYQYDTAMNTVGFSMRHFPEWTLPLLLLGHFPMKSPLQWDHDPQDVLVPYTPSKIYENGARGFASILRVTNEVIERPFRKTIFELARGDLRHRRTRQESVARFSARIENPHRHFPNILAALTSFTMYAPDPKPLSEILFDGQTITLLDLVSTGRAGIFPTKMAGRLEIIFQDASESPQEIFIYPTIAHKPNFEMEGCYGPFIPGTTLPILGLIPNERMPYQSIALSNPPDILWDSIETTLWLICMHSSLAALAIYDPISILFHILVRFPSDRLQKQYDAYLQECFADTDARVRSIDVDEYPGKEFVSTLQRPILEAIRECFDDDTLGIHFRSHTKEEETIPPPSPYTIDDS